MSSANELLCSSSVRSKLLEDIVANDGGDAQQKLIIEGLFRVDLGGYHLMDKTLEVIDKCCDN